MFKFQLKYANATNKHRSINELYEKHKLPQIYVYCGGKSGSTTLEASLKPYYPLFRAHNPHSFQILTNQRQFSIYQSIVESAKTYEEIHVIDVYRLPIERSISSFFENKKQMSEMEWNRMDVRKLIHEYNGLALKNKDNLYPETYNSLNHILHYFKLPLMKTFNFKLKYNKTTFRNIHLIKLRFQDIREWKHVLKSIFNKQIPIITQNHSKYKPYYAKYKEFLNNFTMSKQTFDTFINPDFYVYNTEEEQNTYISKWKSHITN